MITLHVGGVPFQVDPAGLTDQLGRIAQDAMRFEGVAPAKARVIRLGIKLLMREFLGAVERAVIAGELPYPAPDWEQADADVIAYGTSYLLAMLMADLSAQEYTARYEDGPNGEIIITGIAARPALAAGVSPQPDATSTAAATGAGVLGSTGSSGYPATDAAGAAAGASGDPRHGGRYLDAGGDEGERQDHGGPASVPGAVAPVA
jgi:hypothetical protein